VRVLVTNADYANSLASVRSLGRKGIEVVTASHRKRSQAFHSKYSSERLVHPDPADEQAFVDFMLRYLGENKIDVLLPIGYDVNMTVSRHLAEFSRLARSPVPPWESMRTAGDKRLTVKLASDLGVGTPRTYKDKGEVDAFPVVVKGATGSGRLRYVNKKDELDAISTEDAVIQEYVPGTGFGFFALMREGEPRAHFMHRRLREYPVTGGASTAAESVFDPELKELGTRLLSALKWHGVAMAEFKKDRRDGKFKLMEVNPKFWGSLDLAIAAGVDFPYLAVRMALDGDVETTEGYRTGVRFRWPFPYDMLHLLSRPSSAWSILRESFDPRMDSNICLSDLRPNLFQMATTPGSVATRLRRGTLRHPHGVPRMGQ